MIERQICIQSASCYILSFRRCEVSIILVLMFSLLGGKADCDEGDKKTTSQHVAHAKTLSRKEFHRYVESLGEQKNIPALMAIYESNLPGSEHATRKLCNLLDTEKAIAFCSSLDLQSKHWRSAMFSLRRHPKRKVIGYFKQMASSSIPEVRWCCYEICGIEKWDDLVPAANKDLNNNAQLKVPSIQYGTLGEAARCYIDSFQYP